MICAGITYDAGNNRITVQYDAADGAKGASFDNPYTLEDIYDTAISAEWGITISRLGSSYQDTYINATLYVNGALTYFQIISESLTIDAAEDSNFYINDANAKIEGGTGTVSSKYVCIKSIQRKRINTLGNCVIKEAVFAGFSVWYNMYGTNLTNVVIQGLSYPSIKEGNSMTDVTIIGGTYGLLPFADLVENNRVKIIGSTYGMSIGYTAEVNYRNITFLDCGYDIALLPTGAGRVANIYDSVISNIRTLSASNGRDVTLNLFTTFNATIENASGGELTIEDKDGNVVYSETLSSDDMTEDSLLYYKQIYGKADDVEINETTEYEPFTLKVTKPGYRTLEIPDITITPGVPTTVFGKMEAITLTGEALEHNITEDELIHTIKEDELIHIITD